MFYPLLATIIVSAVSLIGVVTLGVNKKKLNNISLLLVSFAVGNLFGDAFIHLLPEAFENSINQFLTSLLIILGILIFFALEKFLRWKHCHQTDCQNHLKPMATINIFADLIHNFIDGALIAAGFTVSNSIGFAITLAIIFHEIPQELGDFGVLIHSGLTVKKALILNFLTACAAVGGAIFSFFLGARLQNFSQNLIPIAAGGFIYIAGSDLIPELHHTNDQKSSLIQFFSILAGIIIMMVLKVLS